MNPKILSYPRFNFSAWTGRGVKVAVIDSGIDPQHPKISRVQSGIEFAVNGRGKVIRGIGTVLVDRAGHGTACAGIIHRIAPAAELHSVCVFDESLCADGRVLLEALRWAIECRMDVVNLSLGTTDSSFKDELQTVCQEALEAQMVLIAAAHNDGLESFPAVLPEVIGVRGGEVQGLHGYYYRRQELIECIGRGGPQRVCWAGRREIMREGSSFAAPHIAGLVALVRQALPDALTKMVRTVLAANALPGGPVRRSGKVVVTSVPGWMRRVALYPFNKEIHALVRFRDLLPFEVVGIADPIGKGLVGKDAAQAIGEEPMGMVISARVEVATRNADTLILGYVDQLGRVAKKDLLRACIEKALDRKLHVFSFAPVWPEQYSDLHQRAKELGLHLAYPHIENREVLAILKKGPEGNPVSAPVLGVFGTSSSQGKFTVQLILRRKLAALGLKIGQLGTEPHAELFGMDGSFPMGYASPLRIPLQHYPAYLDAKLRAIDKEPRDIILTGSQSGTIPYDMYNPRTYAMGSLAFLLGTRPDACVLVVNSIDADDYIQDTLDALRCIGKTRVLALAMSDKEKHPRQVMGRVLHLPRQLNAEEIDTKLIYLERRFGLPAISILSEYGQERLVELILDYFGDHRKEEPKWGKQNA